MNDAASFNAFADALAQFDRLADLMGLDEPTRARYRGKDAKGNDIPTDVRVSCETCKQ